MSRRHRKLPLPLLGWNARQAALITGLNVRTVQAWRERNFYSPQVDPGDISTPEQRAYIKLHALYGACDLLALRVMGDLRMGLGIPLAIVQRSGMELGGMGIARPDDDYYGVSLDLFAKDRWWIAPPRFDPIADGLQPEGEELLRYFTEEQAKRMEEDCEGAVKAYALWQTAERVAEGIWAWKDRGGISMLPPWMSPNPEREIEEAVARTC